MASERAAARGELWSWAGTAQLSVYLAVVYTYHSEHVVDLERSILMRCARTRLLTKHLRRESER